MNVSKLRKNFPPASGPYKICVNGGEKWSDHAHARLQISINQEKHNGDKFAATMEWASHRFHSQTLIISDTLQRHNYITQGFTPEEAMRLAYQDGLNWFEKNRETIEKHNRVNITFWNDWLNCPTFKAKHFAVKTAYIKDIALNDLINDTAKHFAKKYDDQAKGFQSSLNYILEELAAFSLMYDNDQTIDIYPGHGLRDTLVYLKQHYPDLFGNYAGTAIDFVRNKAYQANTPAQQKQMQA